MTTNITCTCGNGSFKLRSESVFNVKSLGEIDAYNIHSLDIICTKCGFVHELSLGFDEFAGWDPDDI